MAAELMLRGGRVFGTDLAGDIAVEGGLISSVGLGSESSVEANTRVIDLDGRLVVPGFQDAHVHPATSGLDLLRCSFEHAHDAASAVEAVADYAASNPGASWIKGAGWAQTWFDRGCPSKELLDAVVPDRPAVLWNRDGHGAWTNSVALQIAGVTASTPDPPHGRIERNPDGGPQGTLHEEGAVALVESHAPADTSEDLVAGLVRGQEELLRYGVTGWQDAAVTPVVHESYVTLERSGGLVGTAIGALWWDRDRGIEQIEELVERRRQGRGRYRPTAVKLMLDGVAETFTASMLEPWLDSAGTATSNYGIDLIEREALLEIVPLLDGLGFQCHFHAVGDRAARNALDSVETAIERNGRGLNRHHIAHLQIVDPEDIPRFAELDVSANAQPLWACNDREQVELTQPFLGSRRAAFQYPFGSLVRAGAHLGMGSDWAVSTANVMEEIAVAVSRRCPEEIKGSPLGDDQALTPEEALTAFTHGSAFLNHRDDESGTIEAGNQADLAILDSDPRVESTWRATSVDMTIVAGKVVFDSGGQS